MQDASMSEAIEELLNALASMGKHNLAMILKSMRLTQRNSEYLAHLTRAERKDEVLKSIDFRR